LLNTGMNSRFRPCYKPAWGWVLWLQAKSWFIPWISNARPCFLWHTCFL